MNHQSNREESSSKSVLVVTLARNRYNDCDMASKEDGKAEQKVLIYEQNYGSLVSMRLIKSPQIIRNLYLGMVYRRSC